MSPGEAAAVAAAGVLQGEANAGGSSTLSTAATSTASPGAASSFAGVVVNAAAGTLDVYLTRDDAGTRTLVSKYVALNNIRFHIVRNSYRDLLRTQDIVAADKAALAQSGVDWVGSYPDPASNTVVVEVSDLQPADQAVLDHRYGSGKVTVAMGYPATITSTRFADGQPWYGGDILGDTGGDGICTAGVPVHNSAGARFLFTAGHCFPQGASTTNNYNFVGTVTDRHYYANNGVDAEIITSNSGDEDWTQNATANRQAGAASAAGAPVCLSGVSSNEVCGLTVKSVGGMATEPGTGWQVRNVDTTYAISGTAVREGDSGGPVFIANSGGTVQPVGIVLGVNGKAYACNTQQGQAVLCGHALDFTDLNYLDSLFHMAPN